jgi:hypothetical protein
MTLMVTRKHYNIRVNAPETSKEKLIESLRLDVEDMLDTTVEPKDKEEHKKTEPNL